MSTARIVQIYDFGRKELGQREIIANKNFISSLVIVLLSTLTKFYFSLNLVQNSNLSPEQEWG